LVCHHHNTFKTFILPRIDESLCDAAAIQAHVVFAIICEDQAEADIPQAVF
jgi:hypothetical protein